MPHKLEQKPCGVFAQILRMFVCSVPVLKQTRVVKAMSRIASERQHGVMAQPCTAAKLHLHNRARIAAYTTAISLWLASKPTELRSGTHTHTAGQHRLRAGPPSRWHLASALPCRGRRAAVVLGCWRLSIRNSSKGGEKNVRSRGVQTLLWHVKTGQYFSKLLFCIGGAGVGFVLTALLAIAMRFVMSIQISRLEGFHCQTNASDRSRTRPS